MAYTISYFNEAVQNEVLSLPNGILARYFLLTDRMMGYGANLGMPHTESFGGGLFELRLKSAEGIGRVFYCTLSGSRIVMLHSFIKKTAKTPPRERRMAELRLKELKDENA